MDAALLSAPAKASEPAASASSATAAASAAATWKETATRMLKARVPMLVVSLPAQPPPAARADEGEGAAEAEDAAEGGGGEGKEGGEGESDDVFFYAQKTPPETAGILEALLEIPTRLTIKNSAISQGHHFVALIGTLLVVKCAVCCVRCLF
jgi:hypothetical protein